MLRAAPNWPTIMPTVACVPRTLALRPIASGCRGVFRLDERRIGSMTVPRAYIVCLEAIVMDGEQPRAETAQRGLRGR